MSEEEKITQWFINNINGTPSEEQLALRKVYELNEEIERLNNIIKEVREYIAHYVDNEYRNGRDDELYLELNEKELKELLEILDKENI